LKVVNSSSQEALEDFEAMNVVMAEEILAPLTEYALLKTSLNSSGKIQSSFTEWTDGGNLGILVKEDNIWKDHSGMDSETLKLYPSLFREDNFIPFEKIKGTLPRMLPKYLTGPARKSVKSSTIQSSVQIESSLKDVVDLIKGWFKRWKDGLMSEIDLKTNVVTFLKGKGLDGREASKKFEEMKTGAFEQVLAPIAASGNFGPIHSRSFPELKTAIAHGDTMDFSVEDWASVIKNKLMVPRDAFSEISTYEDSGIYTLDTLQEVKSLLASEKV
jgi:hypothetical protein